jgi:ADP-ribosylation factor-like protein 1
LVVFANKQDLDGSLSASEISTALGLSLLKRRKWQIFRTSAIKGEGLYEGLDWVVHSLQL